MTDDPKLTKPNKPQEHQVSVQIDPHIGTGVYSNFMMISHRKEEFILDFLFIQPQSLPQGQSLATLRSRVIASPQHAKRIMQALQENIRRYEDAFGVIENVPELSKIVH